MSSAHAWTEGGGEESTQRVPASLGRGHVCNIPAMSIVAVVRATRPLRWASPGIDVLVYIGRRRSEAFSIF